MDEAIRLMETAESQMAREGFSEAVTALLNALAIAPNWTLALYKAGLCVLAGNGMISLIVHVPLSHLTNDSVFSFF